jgi:pimeloyl-ACP methyl ester carboxylesterase
VAVVNGGGWLSLAWVDTAVGGLVNEGLTPFVARPHGALVRGVRGGDGPPALLLHGTAGSWRNFRPWLPALLPRAHLVIPDLPGFGDSPAPSLRPRLLTWARLLRALTADLQAPPRIVIGLGFGASVALAYLQLLRAAPPSAALPALTHLVLYAPAYYPGAIQPSVRRAVRLLSTPPVFGVARALLEQPRFQAWYLDHVAQGPDVPAEDTRLLREDFRRASLPVLRGLARDVVRADFRPLLRTCLTPTLALIGERDPFVRTAAVEGLPRLMPHASAVVQRGLAHGWTPTAVAEQNRLLAEFLDRATPPLP